MCMLRCIYSYVNATMYIRLGVFYDQCASEWILPCRYMVLWVGYDVFASTCLQWCISIYEFATMYIPLRVCYDVYSTLCLLLCNDVYASTYICVYERERERERESITIVRSHMQMFLMSSPFTKFWSVRDREKIGQKDKKLIMLKWQPSVNKWWQCSCHFVAHKFRLNWNLCCCCCRRTTLNTQKPFSLGARFRHQRSAVRIQSLAKFYVHHL